MKLTTANYWIAASLVVPGTMVAGASAHLPPLPESRKLVHVNRVDRVSTNADWIEMEWPAATPSKAPSLATELTAVDARTSSEDFAPPAPEPTAVIASSRAVVSRPAGDSRFPGRRGLRS